MGNKHGKEFDISKVKPDERTGKMLKAVPLLARFSDEERALLGGVLEKKAFKSGEAVVRQGDVGHGFYIIVEGKAVVTRVSESKQEEAIGELGTGDYFGEAALINDSRRGATVSANGDLQCLYLDRDAFGALFTQERLNVQFAKRNAVSAELLPARTASIVAPVNATKDKTPEQRALILKAVKGNLLFEGLSTTHTNLIIDSMWRQEVAPGASIIEQGDLGDNLYVVESGSFDIFVHSGGKAVPKPGRKVAVRGKGTCFGELALMYNAPRAATVTATKPSAVWAVDRFTFRRVLANVSDAQLGEYERFLKRVELLAPLSNRERSKIAEALEEVTFEEKDVIVKQGEQGDCMYILRSGEVVCTIDGNEVKRYREGEYFGERALIKDEPRAATLAASAQGQTQLLRLDRDAFSLLLGPLEDIMSKNVDKYAAPSPSEEALNEKASAARSTSSDSVVAGGGGAAAGGVDDNAELPLSKTLRREDLIIIGTLGKGSFGHVQLVKDPKTNVTYALKSVSKQQIVQTGQQGHIMSEKRVMAHLDHPFLVRLWATYKDKDRLYFLMEPALGGELFSVLRARTFFDENTARYYAASVVLAFEHMHSKNIIYRDLKPENILLSSTGSVKITDFGFAKVVSGRTYTLCGTPDYLAPEIVAGKGHGKGVDWWTLGILIFEMLASYPPFYNEDPMKTYSAIMAGKVSFPSHFSGEAVDLIRRLLHHKPTKRLGVVKGGAKLIKEHPWFKSINWKKLYDGKIKAPIVPTIRSSEDLGNFDSYADDDDVPVYQDPGTNWEADF